MLRQRAHSYVSFLHNSTAQHIFSATRQRNSSTCLAFSISLFTEVLYLSLKSDPHTPMTYRTFCSSATSGGAGGPLTTQGGGIPAALPRSIKYEKLVLCFTVWFKEPWYEEDGDGFDVRIFTALRSCPSFSTSLFKVLQPPNL